jgi:hypothetical protein
MQRIFPSAYYKFIVEDLKNFTFILPKAKFIFNTEYYSIIVNYESDVNKKTFWGRRRDQYLSYDFDQIKVFYENNLSK